MASFRKRPPANPELQRLRLHAQQLMQSKRHDLAEGVLNQILTTVPDDAQAYRQLALSLIVLRRPEEALEHAKQALSLQPDSFLSHTTMGLALRWCEQHAEAIPFYMQALQLKADCSLAFDGLANIFAEKANWDDALGWADKALSIEPSDLAMLRIRSEVLAALNKPDEALATMQEFLRLAPDNVLSQAAAASVLRRLGKFDKAAEFAERALAMCPDDPALHNRLARLKLKTGKYDAAQRHFSEAEDIYQTRLEGRKGSARIELNSLMGKAAVSLRKRDYPAAEAQYRRVLELYPDHGRAHALLGAVLGAENRFDDAITMARDTVGRYPKLHIARVLLGGLLARMEQYPQALRVAGEALELNAASPLSHQVFTEIYLEMEDFYKAVESAQAVVQIKQYPEGYRLLGRALAGVGRRDEAIALIESVLREEPDSPSSHESAGHTFYLLGDYDKAELYFVRAGELDNGTHESLGWLGLCYFKKGKISEAFRLLEKSISINPYQRRVRAALSEIAAPRG